MSYNLPLNDCSIYDIYCAEQVQYAIPIYQRNYAWGSGEILDLFENIVKKFC